MTDSHSDDHLVNKSGMTSHLGTWTLPTGESCDVFYDLEKLKEKLKPGGSITLNFARIEWNRKPNLRDASVARHWFKVIVPEIFYNLITAPDVLETLPVSDHMYCPKCERPAISRSALSMLARGRETTFPIICGHCQHRFDLTVPND